jgi:hypothetical protein
MSRFNLRSLASAAVMAAALAAAPALAETDKQDFSAAEKLLLMARQLDNVKLPSTLRYRFTQSGTAEPGVQGAATVSVTPMPGTKACCNASGSFLSGEREIKLPAIESAEGNPVVLYFLENDIRTMNRLTKGSQTYFRKRIRMALYQGATVQPVKLAWQGKQVDGQEIVIRPYTEDPNAVRFPKYVGKQYRFMLSQAVPGGVYAIQTFVAGDTPNGDPLLKEELLIEGATAPALPRS